jgi:uncharacterized membrane protein (DUF485 family)
MISTKKSIKNSIGCASIGVVIIIVIFILYVIFNSIKVVASDINSGISVSIALFILFFLISLVLQYGYLLYQQEQNSSKKGESES